MEKEQKENRKTENRKIEILGIPVDMVTMDEAMLAFDKLMRAKSSGVKMIATPNSEILVNAQRDPAFSEVLRSADLVIPDGIGLVYASRILDCPLRERVTGVDFLSRILGYLVREEKSIFLLGSKPGENGRPGVAELAAEKMKETWPNLRIAGTGDGYFNAAQEPELVARINRSGADFLCVALGSPKQEQFVWRNRESLTVKAAIGVGGSLDVWAGTVKRAPEFYRKHGLEWLYRFAQQPSRYKRMAAIPLFMVKVLFTEKQRKSQK